ncbi:MAG: rhodanese-like domain-containing protein, partial [Candidatus Hydromicrobium sp.]
DELEGRLDELPVDKPIITYCKSGGRSRNAANILVENGFTQIYDMGGILDWIDKGYPISVEE